MQRAALRAQSKAQSLRVLLGLVGVDQHRGVNVYMQQLCEESRPLLRCFGL